MSPNSVAHFLNTASGSSLASGMLPMGKRGLGPGGRCMGSLLYCDRCGEKRHSAVSNQHSARNDSCTGQTAFNRKECKVRDGTALPCAVGGDLPHVRG